MSKPLRVVLTFAVGCAIFIGLPLAAWGVGDLRGYAGHPARAAYLVLVTGLNAFASIRIPEIGKPRGDEQRTVQRQRLAVLLFQVIPLAIVAWGPFADRRSIAVLRDAAILRWGGVLLYAVGFLAMHWAEAHLGRLFSVQVAIQRGHRLVTDGPYRFLRHPRYAGVLLFLSGLSLLYRSWPALCLVAVVLLVVVWRIGDEEALMREHFGAEWDDYARRTSRLVPGLY